MLFKNATFSVDTQVRADSGTISTNVTLTESDVSDETVANALISGQSPRVAYQNRWRKNGIPKEVKMSWADWIGRPKQASTAKVRDYTPDEIKAAALKAASENADERAKLIAELQAMG